MEKVFLFIKIREKVVSFYAKYFLGTRYSQRQVPGNSYV